MILYSEARHAIVEFNILNTLREISPDNKSQDPYATHDYVLS